MSGESEWLEGGSERDWLDGTTSQAPWSADEPLRPGGWVDGIGWVALYGDLDMGDIAVAGVHQPPQSVLYIDSDCPIVVHRWADGSTPQAPTPQADGGGVDADDDPRVCPATSTRPPGGAIEANRRYRLTCPACGRNVGMVGGFIARHFAGES